MSLSPFTTFFCKISRILAQPIFMRGSNLQRVKFDGKYLVKLINLMPLAIMVGSFNMLILFIISLENL